MSDEAQNRGHKPTGKTMIAIVPPADICGFADHYRRLYMGDKMGRIEPHITLTVPFVPFEELQEAAPRLQEVLASCPPRALAIRGFATFPDDGVLYLYVAQPERILSLYNAILAEFPDYPAFGGKYGDNLVPHLTVGTFSDPEELERVYTKLSVQRLFIGWDVEYLCIFYEGDDNCWHVWADMPLGVPLMPRND